MNKIENKYSVCESCGKEFDQIKHICNGQNYYSHFRICPSCREMQKIKMKKDRAKINCTIPYEPTEKEKQIKHFYETHQTPVFISGIHKKTRKFAIAISLHYFFSHLENTNENQFLVFVAPNKKVARKTFEIIKKLCPKELICDINDKYLIIETFSYGLIVVLNNWNKDFFKNKDILCLTIENGKNASDYVNNLYGKEFENTKVLIISKRQNYF